MIAPDTQQNILYTLYFILIHNFEAMLYVVGIFSMTLWALYRPTRGKIIIMWGFVILLFSFEYSKHILEPLKEQTIQSLITERESIRIEYYITKILTRVVPFGLPILGWMLIGIGAFFDRIYAYVRNIWLHRD
ncbi:MAG: hypothetical protein O3B87_01360 [bacterium]|nr:hypothetical protein [bacterium]